MIERKDPIAAVSGLCSGTTGEIKPPVSISLTQYPEGRRVIDCEQQCLPCIWTIFKRAEHEQKENPEIRCITKAGELVLNSNSGEIIKSPYLEQGHEPILLPNNEANILEVLMINQGKVVDRAMLVDSYNSYKKMQSPRTIDVQVSRIRRAIGQPLQIDSSGYPSVIETIRNRGYRLTHSYKNNP